MNPPEKVRHQNEIAKDSIIAMAREHKKTCTGDCEISLLNVRIFLENSGVYLTEEEQRLLI